MLAAKKASTKQQMKRYLQKLTRQEYIQQHQQKRKKGINNKKGQLDYQATQKSTTVKKWIEHEKLRQYDEDCYEQQLNQEFESNRCLQIGQV